MKSLCILLTIFTLSTAKTIPFGRIANGSEASPGQFPFQALLSLFADGDTILCGGSLLSHRYVLTAAQCLFMSEDGFVLLGAHNRLAEEDHQARVDVTAADYLVHEDFTIPMMRNDIGLVKLPVEVAFSGYVQPVKLPRWSDGDFAGAVGTIAGWGTRSCEPRTDFSDVLNYVTNPIYSNQKCQGMFWLPGLIADQNVCMSVQGGRTACVGDFGGAVTVQDGGDVIQIGVFSFGSVTEGAEGIPTACARVSYFLDWIQANSDVIIEA
ncbi:brachyurin-like [Culex pipiens pallens]|uniref:brachyurin-like n=1 Tax=Culex pipiens pallens TaxID=42434 RepID=UPI0022AAE589|nr:brachyurin-like [Culex pipiens pallens]